jgi:protein SCO1
MDRRPARSSAFPARWTAALIAAAALLPPGSALGDGHADRERAHPAPARAAEAPGYERLERAYAVPDVTLVDQDARPVRLRELLAADEPVLLNFIFTSCPGICPVMGHIFAGVPRELGGAAERVRLVSISIDPEHDTPRQLKAYAARFEAGPRWSFLTGSVESVAAVQRAFEAWRPDKMDHSPLTLLRTASGHPWVRIEGFAPAAALAREVREHAAD